LYSRTLISDLYGSYIHRLLTVEHGRFFGSPNQIISPHSSTFSSTPNFAAQSVPTPPDTTTVTPAEPAVSTMTPYLAYGFIIDTLTRPVVPAGETRPTPTRVVYLSDVSKIPERAWDIITRPVSIASLNPSHTVPPVPLETPKLATDAIPTSQVTAAQPIVPTLVIMDCLRATSHSSHFGLSQTYSTCRRLLDAATYRNAPEDSPETGPNTSKAGRRRAYMIGFSHEFTAAEWDCIGDVVAGERAPSEFSNVGNAGGEDNWKEKDGGVRPTYVARALDALVGAIPSLTQHESSAPKAELSSQPIAEEDRIWMRPGWDGLRLFLRGQDVYDHDSDNGTSS